MIKRGIQAFRGKKVLLLQGPMGPFFRRLARDLEWAGAKVCKVNFNGGDWLFYPAGSIAFHGRMEEWEGFLDQLLAERGIDIVLLFGDCRPIHKIARRVATDRGIDVGVFEEGYLRPNHITFERFGVNALSRLPRTPLFYLNRFQPHPRPVQKVGNSYWYGVVWAILYYVASALLWPLFRHYRHHRPLMLLEMFPWLRSAWRKWIYAVKEKGVQGKLETTLSRKYFLVPLQVHNDAQICMHSDFEDVGAFIRFVVASFAEHAPADIHLVIKHHPMDRGYHDYRRLIARLALAHGLRRRVHYIHDQHLPTLLRHARGVVVVNSTVGLSALHHRVPVKVCGKAVYDMQGLTCQSRLDTFWSLAHQMPPSQKLYLRFRAYLAEHTQLNGSFYKRLPIPGSHAGLNWPADEDSQAAPAEAVPDQGTSAF
ncbi:MAG: capsular biosynthesis protein [Desulfuromonas sp.]|nr:capsular biosynthesis protein [Desulfuromonas sp.]